MWKAKRTLEEQMSWMWIFALDCGLCLTTCLFLELPAPLLATGTDTAEAGLQEQG